MVIHAIPVQQNGGENIPPFSLVTYAFVRALCLVWCPVCIDFFFCCKTHELLAILYDSTQMSLLWPTFHSAFFVVAFWAMQFVLQLALTRRRRFWCSFVSHWWSCITSAWGDWETNYCSFVVADLYYQFFPMAIVSYPLPYLVQEENQSIIIATAANNRFKSSKLRIISMNHQCTSIVMSIPSRRPPDSDKHHNSWIQFHSDLFVSFPVDYGHPVTIERCKPRKILLQIVIQLHKKSNIDLLQQVLQQFKTILSLCSPKHKTRQLHAGFEQSSIFAHSEQKQIIACCVTTVITLSGRSTHVLWFEKLKTSHLHMQIWLVYSCENISALQMYCKEDKPWENRYIIFFVLNNCNERSC